MPLARHLAVLSLAAAVALTTAGCKPRGAQPSVGEVEGSAETQRRLAQLEAQNIELRDRLQKAGEELDKNRTGTVGEAAAIGAVDGFTTVGGGRVALGEDFAFEKGSATLNKDGKKAVERLALRLNEGDLASQAVVVEGHTDDSPVSRPVTIEKYVDNWGLSGARAAAVVRALQGAGVRPERLRGSFRGQYAPAAGKDKAASRRVEIYVTK